MHSHSGLNAYRQTEVQSRTPLELVVMLYDGAIRFLGAASAAIERRDIAGRREATSRALAIIGELQSTLDLDKGGEIASSLDDLYTYLTQRIMDAVARNDAAPLAEARRILETLRDAWRTVAVAPPATPSVSAGTGR